MNIANYSMFLIFICSIASAITSESSPKRVRDLITKIYAKLNHSELSKNGNESPPYPGKFYDVGGYRLHLFCKGTSKNGHPTVLFESGSGSHSTGWLLIQEQISESTRVCAYDRAGYGWSDEWPALKNKAIHDLTPRTIDQNVESLNQLLTQAGISGPIILVGHSYGGPMALAFEAQFPSRVSGLILIDPHDDGDAREDSDESDVISNSLKQLEKEKSLKPS